jgi:amidohydrolase
MNRHTLTPEQVARLVETRRDIHQHPELGYHEHRTAELVRRRLVALGLDVRTGIGLTGVRGVLTGRAGEGPTVLFRADMDALPIQELGDGSFCSKVPGVMHACGHDAHTAIGLALAERLVAEVDTLPGRVVSCFQPAEEGGNGALRMIEDGLLDDPPVDAVFGLHVWNQLEVGKVAIVPGAMMASVDEITLTITGSGGHGAVPHLAIDPILAASQLVVALQSIVSRRVNPFDSAVVTIGSFHSGEAFNVIPGEAILRGTVRTFDRETYERIPQEVERVVAGVCAAMGATYRLDYRRATPPTINDAAMAGLVAAAAEEVVGAENVVVGDAGRTMGGEDFSFMLERRPGCYFFLGTRNAERGLVQPHHSPYFDIDEGALPIGVEILARLARRYLTGNT